MAFHDELAALAGQAAKFHYSDVFGHFDLAALLGIQAAGTQVYVCGLGPMCKQLMRRRKPSVGTVRASEARSFTVILLMLINDDSGGLRVRFFPEYEHGLCPRTETFAPRPLHENAGFRGYAGTRTVGRTPQAGPDISVSSFRSTGRVAFTTISGSSWMECWFRGHYQRGSVTTRRKRG